MAVRLQRLEEHLAGADLGNAPRPQPGLFTNKKQTRTAPDLIREFIKHTGPDAITPWQAHECLYQLRRLLNEDDDKNGGASDDNLPCNEKKTK